MIRLNGNIIIKSIGYKNIAGAAQGNLAGNPIAALREAAGKVARALLRLPTMTKTIHHDLGHKMAVSVCSSG